LGAPPDVRVSPSQLEACTNDIYRETDLLSALEDPQKVQRYDIEKYPEASFETEAVISLWRGPLPWRSV